MGTSREERREKKILLMEFLKTRLAPGKRDENKARDLINLGKMCGRKHGLGFPWSKFGNEIKRYYHPGDARFLDCSHQAMDVWRKLCFWYGEKVHGGVGYEAELDESARLEKEREKREKAQKAKDEFKEEIRREIAAEPSSSEDGEMRAKRQKKCKELDDEIARVQEDLRKMQVDNARERQREKKLYKPKIKAVEPLLTTKVVLGEDHPEVVAAEQERERKRQRKEELRARYGERRKPRRFVEKKSSGKGEKEVVIQTTMARKKVDKDLRNKNETRAEIKAKEKKSGQGLRRSHRAAKSNSNVG
eukprot:g7338.t1